MCRRMENNATIRAVVDQASQVFLGALNKIGGGGERSQGGLHTVREGRVHRSHGDARRAAQRGGRGDQRRRGQGRGGQRRGRGGAGRHQHPRSSTGRDDPNAASTSSAGDSGPAPVAEWHQKISLLGDSMLGRFYAKTCSATVPYNKKFKSKKLGCIVHGQTSSQLWRLLSTENNALGKICLVMIGTNDVLKKVPLETTLSSISKVLDFLASKCEQVVVLTLPPIPKLESNQQTIKVINQQIVGIAAGKKNVHVIDIYHIFYDQDSVKLDLFEMKFKSGDSDKIHWNAKGIEVVSKLIHETFKMSCCKEPME